MSILDDSIHMSMSFLVNVKFFWAESSKFRGKSRYSWGTQGCDQGEGQSDSDHHFAAECFIFPLSKSYIFLFGVWEIWFPWYLSPSPQALELCLLDLLMARAVDVKPTNHAYIPGRRFHTSVLVIVSQNACLTSLSFSYCARWLWTTTSLPSTCSKSRKRTTKVKRRLVSPANMRFCATCCMLTMYC